MLQGKAEFWTLPTQSAMMTMAQELLQNMPPDTESDQKRSFLLTLAKYSQIGFALPAATILGWFLGVRADRWLHTTWLYLAGLILGIVSGFVYLIRTVSKADDNG